MPYAGQFDVSDVLCPIPWWWLGPVHPHRRLDDIIRHAHIPVLEGDYVPVRDDPRPPPIGIIAAIREFISVATTLAAAESEVERAYAMIRQLGTPEGLRRFATVGGLTDQPLEPGEPLRGPRWRWPIQKLVAAALFEAGLATLDTDFAKVLREVANEAANL